MEDGENKNNDDPNLNNITINFVDSLFNQKDNLYKFTKDNILSQNKILKINPKKNKTNENILKPKDLKDNNPKNKFHSKKKNLTIQTTGKKINSNKIFLKNKFLIKEKTTKSNVSQNYPKTARQTENSLNNDSTINSYGNSSNYEIYKIKKESLKERKIYEDRVKVLRNHINALKKQEEEFNRKIELNKEKERNKNIRKKEKENLKQALLSMEIDKRNEMQEKKKIIMEKKLKINLGLKEAHERNQNEKIKNYKRAYKARKKVEEERKEINHKKEENNHLQIIKIKNQREKTREKIIRKKNENLNRLNNSYIKSYQNNKDETIKLKKELSKLELMEEKCLENLKKTKDYIKKNNENYKYNFYQKINLNSDNYKRRRKIANSVERRNNNNINNQNRNIKVKTHSVPKKI